MGPAASAKLAQTNHEYTLISREWPVAVTTAMGNLPLGAFSSILER